MMPTLRNPDDRSLSASDTAVSSAHPRGPSTTSGGPPPHALRREDKKLNVFTSPIAKRWGSTPEWAGGGGTALAGPNVLHSRIKSKLKAEE
jgi:hypothetical protein